MPVGLIGRVFLSCSICYDDVNVEKRHRSGRLVGAEEGIRGLDRGTIWLGRWMMSLESPKGLSLGRQAI
jgi:hypothetical protein